MLRNFLNNVLQLGATIVVLCGGFTACASHDELSPPAKRAVNTRMADLNPSQAEHIARIRERTRWVGTAHHLAMKVIHQDVSARRAAKQPLPKKGSAEYCKLLEKAGKAAIAALDQGRGITRKDSDRDIELRAVPELEKCSNNMSIFSSHASPAFQQFVEEGAEPTVTGAYESYLDLMEAQVNASDWSVAGVSAAVNNVLSTAMADGAAEGDLLALASFAGLAESSAVEWNSYNWGASGDGSCGTTERCLMSLFGRKSLRGKVGAVIAADVGGCLAHVRGWSALRAILMAPAWQALAGRCGIRGGLASGGAILAFL